MCSPETPARATSASRVPPRSPASTSSSAGSPTARRASSARGGRGRPEGDGQQASIAGGLSKPAPILLVDEATSALDTENEAAVVDALTADPRARTQVIVAHRLASIRHADRVLFLDDGSVIEDGTVDELLAAGGRFDEFWRQQREAAEWRILAD